MLDKMFWKVFEKTGNIDAYLLYIDIKNLSDIEDINTNPGSRVNVVNIN